MNNKIIDIFESKDGHLILRVYNCETKKIEQVKHDKDVEIFLTKLQRYPILSVKGEKRNNKEIDVVKYPEFELQLHDIVYVAKQMNYLKPLFSSLKAHSEKKQLKELNDRPKKKVKRVNKYSNQKIIAAFLTVGFLITAITTISAMNLDKTNNDLAYDNEVVMNVSEHEIMDTNTFYEQHEDIPSVVTENVKRTESTTTDNAESVENIANSVESIEIDGNTENVQRQEPASNIENNANPLNTINVPNGLNVINTVNVDDSSSFENVERFNSDIIKIEYEDLSGTDKAKFTKEQYGSIIERYASRYGLDYNLMLGIATQERGVHSTVVDKGGAIGLMQIQKSVWSNANISAYNFETGQYDKFTITEDMLKNLDTNIQLGCMIFQNCLNSVQYNIPMAVQAYNYGVGNLKKVVDTYAGMTGQTRQDVIADQNNVGWLEYRDIIGAGDSNYLNNVLSWMGEKNHISVMNKDHTRFNLTISNNLELNKTY